jgi:hypothetical protein
MNKVYCALCFLEVKSGEPFHKECGVHFIPQTGVILKYYTQKINFSGIEIEMPMVDYQLTKHLLCWNN